jgi:hypothetical protein
MHSSDAGFFDVGLALQDRHDFVDEFVRRHCPGIVRLLVAHERGHDIRRRSQQQGEHSRD